MNELASFLAMGGYAAYVWPAYAVFFIVLIADTLAPRLRRRRLLHELRARMARKRVRDDHASVSTPPPARADGSRSCP